VRALSVRQPYAELIMRGVKRIEYRSRPTNICERVYLYAAKKPGKVKDFERAGLRPGELSTGVLVGTVEVVGCTGEPGAYEWYLANPERLAEPLEPERQPQPAWFYPFSGQEASNLLNRASALVG
jgi:hypothetical protein